MRDFRLDIDSTNKPWKMANKIENLLEIAIEVAKK